MPHKRGKRTYRGYEQPPAGKLPESGQKILRAVYGKCRAEKFPGESRESKSRCARIAWGAVKRSGR